VGVGFLKSDEPLDLQQIKLPQRKLNYIQPMKLFFVFVSITFCAHAQLAIDPFQLVNSPYDEKNPVLSADGNTLYFTISNHPKNIGGVKDPGDIWYSIKNIDVWSAPIHGGSLINDRTFNAVAGVSADGSQLFLMNHFDASGNPARTQGIAIATNSGGVWGRPVNISIPYFQNRSPIISGHLSADGSVFVYAAETYGSVGVEDIYVTIKKEDESWTEPKNLGRTVNTQFQELSPWLSRDKLTLYFSTNGKKGFGSFDVYSATRLDDSWTHWGEPKNIGSDVNSDGRELYFFLLPAEQALYTSTKNSDGYGDIKLFTPSLPSLNKSVDSVVVTPPVTLKPVETVLSENETKVTGWVRDAKTGQPIKAKISFVSSASKREATPDEATKYEVILNSSQQYNVNIEAPGYVSSFEKLSLNSYELKTLEMDFQLQPLEVGTTVNLKNVLFVQSKTELLQESYAELDLVVAFMKANPNVMIELAGHTDNRGSYQQLKKLSQARVDRVKLYLTSKGIDRKRVVGYGYGATKPIASNDTEETRMLNRRVEFIIKKL